MSTESRASHVEDPFAGLPLSLPVPKAAKLLGISRAASYRFASAGDLPVKRLGRRVYVVTARAQIRAQIRARITATRAAKRPGDSSSGPLTCGLHGSGGGI